MSRIDRWLGHFFGRGEAAVTVPSMDGALRPNTRLDHLDAVAIEQPDCLAWHQGETVVASGTCVKALKDGRVLHDFNAPVTAMATLGDSLVVAVEAEGLSRLSLSGVETVEAGSLGHITALTTDGNDLLICEGSARHAPSDWRRCLMERGAYGTDDGAVYRLSLDGKLTPLAEGLAWPCGVVSTGDAIVVSEAWKARLVSLRDGQPVLSDLPGYPGRLSPAKGGGFWLTVFAPRSQLIEFVLRENAYRHRMIAEIDPAYWVAPGLSNGRSFLEPLQGGAVKQMGVLKPWAPSRSYGLLVRLNERFQPIFSLHSRADGDRHGITGVLEAGDVLHIASKGGNEVLFMPNNEEV